MVLSADLRRLDREALSRLAHARVAVVGLVPPGDLAAERQLAQLGVVHVLPADSTVERVSATLLVAAQQLGRPGQPTARAGSPMAWGDPRRAAAEGAVQAPDQPADVGTAGEDNAPDGRILAVWGPHGAPGRTTVAVGLAAAARAAGSGGLDLAALAALARTVAPGLRVLTGIARSDRWLELRPSALEVVLERSRALAPFTVVDCGFCLERDEELSFDTAVPRRNGATLEILQSADRVVVVGSADPVGLQRLIRGIGELREVLPEVTPTVVVNRVRSSAIPGDVGAQVRTALARYTGVEQVHLVPMDVAGLDAAVATGRTLQEAVPGSHRPASPSPRGRPTWPGHRSGGRVRPGVAGPAAARPDPLPDLDSSGGPPSVSCAGRTGRAPAGRPCGGAPRPGRPPGAGCACGPRAPRAGSRR